MHICQSSALSALERLCTISITDRSNFLSPAAAPVQLVAVEEAGNQNAVVGGLVVERVVRIRLQVDSHHMSFVGEVVHCVVVALVVVVAGIVFEAVVVGILGQRVAWLGIDWVVVVVGVLVFEFGAVVGCGMRLDLEVVGCIDSVEDIDCMVYPVQRASSQVERSTRTIFVVVGEVVDEHMKALVVVHFQSSSSLHQCLHLQVQEEEELKSNSGMVANMEQTVEQKPYPCLRTSVRGHHTDTSCSFVLRAFDHSSGRL